MQEKQACFLFHMAEILSAILLAYAYAKKKDCSMPGPLSYCGVLHVNFLCYDSMPLHAIALGRHYERPHHLVVLVLKFVAVPDVEPFDIKMSTNDCD
mmetsp:Transcript_38890/g.85150  ORF Transcript_38890/g.85150 Transcript_38890/m.85150 type:complete len:97 (-) Transcript_38890:1276-1566(-)